MKRGWRASRSAFSCNPNAADIPQLQRGRPSGGSFSREQQLKGSAAAANRRASDDEEEGDGGGPSDEQPQPPIDSQHTVKERKQQEAWREQLPTLKKQWYASLPSNMSRARQFAEARQQTMQEDVNGAWKNHACSSATSAQPLQEGDFQKVAGQGQVTYIGMECTFPITMHKWTCTCCNQTIAPGAMSFGCFPNTPEVAHLWYDLRVMQQYKRLGLGNGTSATGAWVEGVCVGES